jgi:hypothetical protein
MLKRLMLVKRFWLIEKLGLAERFGLAVCCLFLFVAHPLAGEQRYYRILPFSESATTCRHANTAISPCTIIEMLVLKPTNELAKCAATFDTAAMSFKFSEATPNLSCQPIKCSTCDLIPPMPPTETGGHLYRTFSPFFMEQRKAAMYWGINQETGVLTVCAIAPPAAECKTVKP